MCTVSSSAMRSMYTSVSAQKRFQKTERKALRLCSGVTVRRTYLGAPDFPEAVPFPMSRSPYGYDPRDLTAHGKDAGKLVPVDPVFHRIELDLHRDQGRTIRY